MKKMFYVFLMVMCMYSCNEVQDTETEAGMEVPVEHSKFYIINESGTEVSVNCSSIQVTKNADMSYNKITGNGKLKFVRMELVDNAFTQEYSKMVENGTLYDSEVGFNALSAKYDATGNALAHETSSVIKPGQTVTLYGHIVFSSLSTDTHKVYHGMEFSFKSAEIDHVMNFAPVTTQLPNVSHHFYYTEYDGEFEFAGEVPFKDLNRTMTFIIRSDNTVSVSF